MSANRPTTAPSTTRSASATSASTGTALGEAEDTPMLAKSSGCRGVNTMSCPSR
jgi:hypothetical protein